MALNLLLSYAHVANIDLVQVRRDVPCGRILIDSGAFTAWRTGRAISIDAYAAFLERWQGSWDHAVTLDRIGDPKTSAAQTRALHQRGLHVMPVFTTGGALTEFDAMVRDSGYVCVGGLVGMPVAARRARVALLQRRAQNLGGGIHALGLGAPSARDTRPYSADSSNAIQYLARYGMISYFDGRTVRITASAGKPERNEQLRANLAVFRAHGVDVARLARTGRTPTNGPDRAALLQAMGLAYACADEHLRRSVAVPPPRKGLTVGPHLYVAAVSGTAVPALGALVRRLHGDDPAPIWRRYGAGHTCHPRAA